MTNAEARFNNSLRPRKPEGSLGLTAQDGHLDFHTAPELCVVNQRLELDLYPNLSEGASEFRSCADVEVAVLGSPSLTVCTVSVAPRP